MIITKQEHDQNSDQYKDWHKLVVAEDGFSMLDFYARDTHGIDIDIVRQFANQVNDRNEPGSLHPEAPISAFPRWYFRDLSEKEIPRHIDRFCDDIRQFIHANTLIIHATKILVDFHVSGEPVPTMYIDSIEEVFRQDGANSCIAEATLFI